MTAAHLDECSALNDLTCIVKSHSSAQIFQNHVLNIGSDEVGLHLDTQLPDNLCAVVQTEIELMDSIFPDILNNYLDNYWLNNRVVLAAKESICVTKRNVNEKLCTG
ncbi:hypothetical protein TNCV_4140641 [Trichonephila clavipes]|nr:hypothetical protein TNCV_4140641 [Trichonephila clavipes]